MTLIGVRGKLVDTRLKLSGKPTLDFAQVTLEKERMRQREEEKRTIGIEYSEEYLSVKAAKATLFQNEEGVENSQIAKKEISTAQVTYSKIDLKLDILI